MRSILLIVLSVILSGCVPPSSNTYSKYRNGGDQKYDFGSPYAVRSDYMITAIFFSFTGNFVDNTLRSANVRASIVNYADVPISYRFSMVGNGWSYEGETGLLNPGQVLDLGVVTTSIHSWYSTAEVYVIGPIVYHVPSSNG